MIEKFITYLQYEKKYSKHTITAYQNDLICFRDFCVTEFDQENITEIHYNQIRTWIVSLVNDGISNRSVNRKISSLNGFYKFLQKIGDIKVNPLVKHKPLKTQKKIQVPFTKDEAKSVLEKDFNEKDEFTEVRNKLIVELFYSTGIRRAELINIRESDINFFDNTIKVLGKRNKERFVPLLLPVKQTLNYYLDLKKEFEKENEYLFITKKGVKIYEMLVYRIINSYFSGVSTKDKKSPHMLRKELLGHSSLASTQVYTHNSMEQIKKVFNQAHPRSNKNK
ncbi:MAG: integrase [Polaribacter sp.]|nr:MAG: integrase [Polaribacter sp.]